MDQQPHTPPRVRNGTYTVSDGRGQSFQAKLYTQLAQGVWARRFAVQLTPPKFTPIGEWIEDETHLLLWSVYCAEGSPGWFDGYVWRRAGSKQEKRAAVWADLALRGDINAQGEFKGCGYWAQAGYTLALEARCVSCNDILALGAREFELGIHEKCRC